ncbi:hypothetical protein L208DRAFT_1399688 [Tricholoma matsutake]|nr:hypothetical protein L208DRAFT_1399688 [Tricholoma matsutake 945]
MDPKGMTAPPHNLLKPKQTKNKTKGKQLRVHRYQNKKRKSSPILLHWLLHLSTNKLLG